MGERLRKLLAISVFLGAWLAFWLWLYPAVQHNVQWKPYTTYQPPNVSGGCFRIQLTTDDMARALCSGGIGCIKGVMDENNKWVGVPLIIAPAPVDFNDHYHLVILGHELLHLLGAFHD